MAISETWSPQTCVDKEFEFKYAATIVGYSLDRSSLGPDLMLSLAFGYVGEKWESKRLARKDK